MIEIDFNLWNQFEETGKIDDYLAYRLNNTDFEKGQENAFYNRGCSDS